MGLLDKLHLTKTTVWQLESGSASERIAAATDLGNSGKASAANPLLLAYANEHDEDVRTEILRACTALGIDLSERIQIAAIEGRSVPDDVEAFTRLRAVFEVALEREEAATAEAEPEPASESSSSGDEQHEPAADISMDAWAVAIGTARGTMAALAKGIAASAAFEVYSSGRGLSNPAEAADAALTDAFDAANRSIFASMGTAIGVATSGDSTTLDMGERFDTIQKAAFEAAEATMMEAAQRVGPDPLAALSMLSETARADETDKLHVLWILVSASTRSKAEELGATAEDRATEAAFDAVVEGIRVGFDAAEASLRQ